MQEPSTLLVHKQTLPFLNISMYLNNIKPIQSLIIENTSDFDSAQIEVKITTDLACFEPFSYHVSFVPAKKELEIPLINLKVNRDFLNKLSETEKANVTIEVIEIGKEIIQETTTLNIHPLEHFGGFQILPELVAAYITPNHPYIYHIKRKAIDILEKQGLRTAFEGYQSNDPQRVLQIMSAIYTALQSEEIVYSSLPPGYEESGQRLRLLNTIQQEKFGNCIDVSLLFAACIEAVDLNPILIIVRGHAFVGCWLQDDKFPEVVNDDKSAITKRLSKGIREIAAIEATCLCKGNDAKFSDALNVGEAQLVQNEDFILSVDVKRARTLRIRPIPLIANAFGTQLDEEILKQTETIAMEEPFEIGTIYQDELLQEKQPKTKQKIWERKLLDLSLRNNLLNLHITRNMLQLVDIDISHLEDTLSDGKSFSILPSSNAEVLKKYNLFSQPLHHSSPLYQLANDELKHNRLLTHYHQQDLDNILVYIHKNSKHAIEENGSSTLYLAVGLLKWFDRKTPEQPRYAPILLVPIEIGRRSVNSKFTLKSREEETMINITLVEFLRQEYELNLSVLEQLPTDEKGVDVAKVMGIFRRAVMQFKGWDVEEQVILGNFSFSKLILWKDIVVHQEDLLKSDMVRSLVNGKLVFNEYHEPNSESSFESISSQSLVLPIPADVSQMGAVIAAQNGQSFILHGPPGTGKSQTITNIIADALYRGKRVLFVAAKKAALDVVHRRLEQIGLSPFTLELHSNKSKKSDVLEQLGNSIETAKLLRTSDFEQEAKRLDSAKKTISDYVNILHKKQDAGWSLYDSITTLQNFHEYHFPKNFISESVLQNLSTTLWQEWTDWLPQFCSIASIVEHPSENPLSAFNFSQYSPSVHDEISVQTQKLLIQFPELQRKSESLEKALIFPFSIQAKSEWEQFKQVVIALKKLPDIPLELIRYLADKESFSIYEEWSKSFNQYQTVLNSILQNYNRNILNSDISAIEIQWKKAQQSWFLPKWVQIRKIKKQLSVFRSTQFSNDSDIEQLFSLNNQLLEVQRLLQQSRFVSVQQVLKKLFKDEQTDLSEIGKKAELVQQLSNLTNYWERNALVKWVKLFQEKNFDYSDEIKQSSMPAIDEFIQISTAFNEQRTSYETLTGIHFQQTLNWNHEIIKQLQNIQVHLPNLKSWMNYVNLRNHGESLQLQWFIQAYENKACSVENLANYFHCIVHTSVAQRVISQHEELYLFNVDLFENKIEQYKKLAKDFQHLTIQELRVKLAAQLPNTTTEAMQSSEIGILQRAIKNRGRGLSIRKLFDQIPTLLPRIAPCMLMSPISVAQYFDVSTKHFDLLIFDEASQLPTCEAVSALARAKQSVIVGDPKQMPPTSFFSTVKLDEENMDVEDSESILDDCLALSVPSKYLLRHYRSKHESLIAFSNANYYENKLLTFPSSDDLNRKVIYHQVEGFYDKGKTRTNKFEADEIVEFVKSHYNNSQKRKQSLGIVTFSQTQQNLIEDKLQKLFMSDPKLEEYANESDEPLFIKNLENVQGDERDIILFSICYAPDEEGKMSMNFGPLNRDGGWRRLNVAVTRSRYEMHVFATLHTDQIDLSRTSAEGVAGLKAFLNFAEKGYLRVRNDDVQDGLNKHHLSMSISKKLQEKGFKVNCNIGTSGFKVDIGIVHPHKPNQYILGIVIDGLYYYNAQTTNDRELVMPSVLRSLGWNVHRIWTMDWFENSNMIIDSIVAKVMYLETKPDVDEETIAKSVIEPTFELKQELQNEVLTNKDIGKQKPYMVTSLASVFFANSETIYEYQNRNIIKQQIQSLLDTEAPISKSLLYKRVLQAWNTSRAGGRLDKHLESIIEEMNVIEVIHHQPFYWNNNSTLDYYRSNDSEKRNMEDIAPEEVIVALEEVIINNLSIEEEELLRYLAHTFGFSKVGRQLDVLLRNVIDLAIKQERVMRENHRIKIVVK
jgi:superfamily I DNA and/or RNA helicase/very-short-patch-repair endonuclease